MSKTRPCIAIRWAVELIGIQEIPKASNEETNETWATVMRNVDVVGQVSSARATAERRATGRCTTSWRRCAGSRPTSTPSAATRRRWRSSARTRAPRRPPSWLCRRWPTVSSTYDFGDSIVCLFRVCLPEHEVSSSAPCLSRDCIAIKSIKFQTFPRKSLFKIDVGSEMVRNRSYLER